MASGKPREPLKICVVEGVLSGPWSENAAKVGMLWSHPSEEASKEAATAGDVMENTQSLLLVEMVKSCAWNLAPPRTVTSSSLLLGNFLLALEFYVW